MINCFQWLNSFWQIKCSSCVKAVRPLGLAVTVADYLDSARIDAPMSDSLHCCLQRYMMKPSLRSLGRLEMDAVSGGFRLRDRVLERQHSLGERFTKQALGALAGTCSREAQGWVLSAKRICLSDLAVHVPEAFHATHRSASAIVAWISFKLKDFSRGRLSGFQQERSTDQWLLPIQVEHERRRERHFYFLIFVSQVHGPSSGIRFGFKFRKRCFCFKFLFTTFVFLTGIVLVSRGLVMQSGKLY